MQGWGESLQVKDNPQASLEVSQYTERQMLVCHIFRKNAVGFHSGGKQAFQSLYQLQLERFGPDGARG